MKSLGVGVVQINSKNNQILFKNKNLKPIQKKIIKIE